MLTFTTGIHHYYRSPYQSNETWRRNNSYTNWKEVKLILFTDDMMPHVDNPKNAYKKLMPITMSSTLQDKKP
jgi:hypothetical protein